jgi:hypothetical protein
MAVEVHVGEVGVAEVEMRDAQGNVTDDYDKVAGIQWSTTDPASVTLVDDDANPKDATFNFLAITTAPVTATVMFDGDAGDGVTQITGTSEEINVVPGPARSGTVTIKMSTAPVA